MKLIPIRELHARTGHWVRRAGDWGEIRVTDHGRIVAKLSPDKGMAERPFFARRKVSAPFQKLAASGKLRGGRDSTRTISEDREDRAV